MPRLYLMRHGQTQFNEQKLVQGRINSPLTKQGIQQAQTAALWFSNNHINFDYACSSITGRAAQTCDIVLKTIAQSSNDVHAQSIAEHLLQQCPTRLTGLQERCYGTYEGKPMDLLPITPWEPKDILVPFGGESSEHTLTRMVSTLMTVMDDATHNAVLAVSHGSVNLAFLKYVLPYHEAQHIKRLENCCILIFDYNRENHTFSFVNKIEHSF